MSSAIDKFKESKERINKVSSSFCMAKWQQVTMHLHSGTNHSCHHPPVHKVSVEELRENIHALHNSDYKKTLRKMMLRGERPSECQYCWNIEDADTNMYSDRITKSAYSHWNTPDHFKEITSYTGDEDVYPSYLEVSFSNRCNLKCSYCSPVYSSSWAEEIEKHGEYETEYGFNKQYGGITGTTKIDEDSPYLVAFNQWWPSAKPHVKVLRITGGEPLLEKSTFAILEEIANQGYYQDIEVSINTNLSVSQGLISRLKDVLLRVCENVFEVRIYTSCEAAGSAAEYIRYGLQYEVWKSNLDMLLTSLPKVKFTVMTTVNLLSVTTIQQFCRDMLDLKIKHINDYRKVALSISFNMIRYPMHQRLDLLPTDLQYLMYDTLRFLEENQEGKNGNDYYCGYFDYEIHAFERLITFMSSVNSDLPCRITAKRDFYNFFSEYDKRKGLDFYVIFPQLAKFMRHCESLSMKVDDM